MPIYCTGSVRMSSYQQHFSSYIFVLMRGETAVYWYGIQHTKQALKHACLDWFHIDKAVQHVRPVWVHPGSFAEGTVNLILSMDKARSKTRFTWHHTILKGLSFDVDHISMESTDCLFYSWQKKQVCLSVLVNLFDPDLWEEHGKWLKPTQSDWLNPQLTLRWPLTFLIQLSKAKVLLFALLWWN